MSFQTPITIKEVTDSIRRREFVLPAIQREFVWDTNQIEHLFDSIMQGYPVGSFLFWKVLKENNTKFQFYDFIRDFHEKTNKHNRVSEINKDNDLIAILDGQQRLTSLYIGLHGSYSYKMPRKRRDNPTAYPKRYLYLDLLAESNEFDVKYDFLFITEEEAREDNEAGVAHWFKVGDILKYEEPVEVNDYIFENGLNVLEKEQARFVSSTLFKLHKVIHQTPIVNYYLEKDQELDKVLNIFIRVNSGGTTLNYSDLLLSIATAQWKKKDARKEITEFVEEINAIGNGFYFNKDFILKTSLVLCDFTDIAFKMDNFNASTMQTIEDKWEEIKEAIRQGVHLAASFGYSESTLTSNNALIPIIYYLKTIGLPENYYILQKHEEDRSKLKKWLSIALLKRVFGGAPDNVIKSLRKVIQENPSNFPLDEIISAHKGQVKNFTLDEDEIDNLLSSKYGNGRTFTILSMLYPTLDYRNIFHLDHIHPRSYFTRPKLKRAGISEEKIDKYLDSVDLISNIQLLEGIPNIEKSDKPFKEWINNKYPNDMDLNFYFEKHYIPQVSQELDAFLEFIEQREQLLREALLKIVL